MKLLLKKSPFCHPRPEKYPLDMIVIHHIGSNGKDLYSVGGTITWFTDESVHVNKETGKVENKVSAHYIIPRKPYESNDLIKLVGHEDVAYHAGYSKWEVDGKKRKYINNYSIGIELEGDGNLVKYTDFQYDTLIALVKDLTKKYNIPVANIVGHEEISPERKVDPGKFFDWGRLEDGIDEKEAVKYTPSIDKEPAIIDEIPSTAPILQGGEDKTGESKATNFWQVLLGFFKKYFK